jgi:hypothetical protein
MAFDKNTAGQPIIQADKRTTKVNIWVVVGVLVFLLLGVLTLVHVRNNPPMTTHDSLPAAKSGS